MDLLLSDGVKGLHVVDVQRSRGGMRSSIEVCVSDDESPLS